MIMTKQKNISVRCAEPNIIINQSVKQSLHRCVYIHTPHYSEQLYASLRNSYFRYYYMAIRYKSQITYDNINDYYLSTYDGEIIPIFIMVPCNKCFICRDKLSKMWQFRGIAESNTSINKTYFITLTFNDEFLPKRGVSVQDIQLFMKRLRISLDNMNITHKIKYFASGEYGRNTKRPHYHLILWHFPDDKFNNLKSILNFIEKCWSFYDNDTKEHIPIGFCLAKPCDSGSLRYVMKYVRKKQNPPVGKRPMFYCCSKGIGLQFFYDNYNYLKNNPDILKLSINDPIKGDVFTSPFPTYYKNKLIKPNSQFFPREIVDIFQKLLSLQHKQYTLCQLMTFNNFDYCPILKQFYKLYYGEDIIPYIDDTYYYRNIQANEICLISRFDKLQLEASPYIIILNSFLDNFDYTSYRISSKLRNKRNATISRSNLSLYSLDDLRISNEKIEINYIKSLHKEYF